MWSTKQIAKFVSDCVEHEIRVWEIFLSCRQKKRWFHFIILAATWRHHSQLGFLPYRSLAFSFSFFSFSESRFIFVIFVCQSEKIDWELAAEQNKDIFIRFGNDLDRQSFIGINFHSSHFFIACKIERTRFVFLKLSEWNWFSVGRIGSAHKHIKLGLIMGVSL